MAVDRVEEWQGTRPGTVFGDFRKVLDDKDIDALIVGTPDHWHAIPTVFACQAGKHVYVEKPDGHNISEGRLMVAAARKYERVVQMGIQSRSGAHFAEAIDYLRGGAIGRALYARAWESGKQGSIGRPADAPVPEGSITTSGSGRRRNGRSTRCGSTATGAGSSITAPATWATTASTGSTWPGAAWRRR